MGGKSIFVVDRGDKNAHVIFETLTQHGSRYAIVQKYIPDIVATGDSRILVIDGEPAPLLRLYRASHPPTTTVATWQRAPAAKDAN